jgi:Trypsin-co-occurring domain 2
MAVFDEPWGGGGMAEEDRIGLADFLSDLRTELSEAQSRAAGDSLKLGVEEITLTLEVAYTLTKAGEASAGVQAKFWVFASAEAAVKGSLSSERANTQQLTLTLKPRVEQVVIDSEGQQTVVTRGVDVEGALAAGEEQPAMPSPGRS